MGEGAGSGAAASAVMGDIIEVARHVALGLPPIVGDTCTDELPLRALDDLCGKYYLRIAVNDEPGVLAATAKVFGDNEVSIYSMVQAGAQGGAAELIFMTHAANERHVQNALASIEALEQVRRVACLIRIEED